MVFGLRLQPRTSKPSPASALAAGATEFAKSEHADPDVGQCARMHVMPFAALLRALEQVDVATVADHH